jgi:hypothetical protein
MALHIDNCRCKERHDAMPLLVPDLPMPEQRLAFVAN